MPEVSDTLGILRQNLLDAGCGADEVRRCLDLAEKQERGELLRILSLHRRTLLNAVHEGEKRIDCLDYLIYQIKKQENKTHL